MIVRLVSLAIAGLLLTAPAVAQNFTPRDESPEEFAAGPGRDETFYACTACHGVAIIVSQGMSRERWDSTIDEMIRRNAMPEPDAADRRLIVDYLAARFPPRTRGRANPFATRP